jgi:hypothetical protein
MLGRLWVSLLFSLICTLFLLAWKYFLEHIFIYFLNSYSHPLSANVICCWLNLIYYWLTLHQFHPLSANPPHPQLFISHPASEGVNYRSSSNHINLVHYHLTIIQSHPSAHSHPMSAHLRHCPLNLPHLYCNCLNLQLLAKSHSVSPNFIQYRIHIIKYRLNFIHYQLNLIHYRLNPNHYWLNILHHRLNLIHSLLKLIHYCYWLNPNHYWLNFASSS